MPKASAIALKLRARLEKELGLWMETSPERIARTPEEQSDGDWQWIAYAIPQMVGALDPRMPKSSGRWRVGSSWNMTTCANAGKLSISPFDSNDPNTIDVVPD